MGQQAMFNAPVVCPAANGRSKMPEFCSGDKLDVFCFFKFVRQAGRAHLVLRSITSNHSFSCVTSWSC